MDLTSENIPVYRNITLKNMSAELFHVKKKGKRVTMNAK